MSVSIRTHNRIAFAQYRTFYVYESLSAAALGIRGPTGTGMFVDRGICKTLMKQTHREHSLGPRG
eukprot:3385756-Pyramimonas_sp.AAC.1